MESQAGEEIGQSANDKKRWVTIHSGSRNFGKCICDYWQKLAKKQLADRRKEIYHQATKGIESVPPRDREEFLKNLRSQQDQKAGIDL